MKQVARSVVVAGLVALAGPAQAELIYGMTAANGLSTSPGLGLVSFDSATPGTVATIGSFSGVVAGHAVRSIDFRPATGELWAISTGTTTGNFGLAQLYTVNLATAALTPVGSGFTLTGNTSPRVEIDFNPTVDRIRILTGGATANNFRANPLTGGLVQADTDLSRAPGDLLDGVAFSIVGAAYTNNVPGATSTTLFAYDYSNDAVVTIGGPNGAPSPNGGQLFTVSAPEPDVFLTTNAALGMDVSGLTGTLYITHDDPVNIAPMRLYTIDTTTGLQTEIGAYANNLWVTDISVAPAVPEPATWLMGAMGFAALLLHRRRRAAG
jgi:MYXO-CTERM domain-containing protein